MLTSHFPKTSETQTTTNIERQIKQEAYDMSKAHTATSKTAKKENNRRYPYRPQTHTAKSSQFTTLPLVRRGLETPSNRASRS
jgi:hypothetical protein